MKPGPITARKKAMSRLNSAQRAGEKRCFTFDMSSRSSPMGRR